MIGGSGAERTDRTVSAPSEAKHPAPERVQHSGAGILAEPASRWTRSAVEARPVLDTE
jgi:hypothetical protein